MIISHSKKFIFIHSRKTAGSSVGISLMRYLSSGDIVRGYMTGGLKYGIKPPDWNKSLLYLKPRDFYSSETRLKAYRRFVKASYNVSSTHLNAKQIQELVGKDIWEKYYTFTFVRNPFDRIISFYFWRTKHKKNPPSFKEFITSAYLKKEKWLKDNNLDGYSTLPSYMINGEISVDYIARFENLASEVKFIFNRIGLLFDGWIPFDKKGIRPKKAIQKKMYDKGSIQQMKKIFAVEISLFGYNPDI